MTAEAPERHLVIVGQYRAAVQLCHERGINPRDSRRVTIICHDGDVHRLRGLQHIEVEYVYGFGDIGPNIPDMLDYLLAFHP